MQTNNDSKWSHWKFALVRVKRLRKSIEVSSSESLLIELSLEITAVNYIEANPFVNV